jgi:chromosome segregation ATPase
MAAAAEHIKRIEEKLSLLVGKCKSLMKENERLKRELELANEERQRIRERNEQLNIQIGLRQQGEKEEQKAYRHALEKKISEYIKEIDRCIAQLGDQG